MDIASTNCPQAPKWKEGSLMEGSPSSTPAVVTTTTFLSTYGEPSLSESLSLRCAIGWHKWTFKDEHDLSGDYLAIDTHARCVRGCKRYWDWMFVNREQTGVPSSMVVDFNRTIDRMLLFGKRLMPVTEEDMHSAGKCPGCSGNPSCGCDYPDCKLPANEGGSRMSTWRDVG